MGFNEFLTKLFGNKSQRDMREVSPIVGKIKAYDLTGLSHDALRARTQEIRAEIQGRVSEERAKVKELKETVERTEINEREKIYNEIDKL